MSRKLAIGVDLGGTNIRIALGDKKGKIVERVSQLTEKEKGPEGLSNQIIRLISFVLRRGYIPDEIVGIGIGSTGPLDLNKGCLLKPTNIPFDIVPLVEPITENLKMPTYLLNDCTSAVVGEKYFGAGKGVENLAYITLSTGIGGGIYVDGRLLYGKEGNATEIGHFTIDYTGRLSCSCGRRGHWEAYCSGNGIPHLVNLLLKEKSLIETENSMLANKTDNGQYHLTVEKVFEAAKADDYLAKQIVRYVGRLNAIGFAAVTDAYDPSLITVGGGVALNNPEMVIQPIQQNIENHARNRVPQIAITPLGEDTVLLGAIAAVFHPPE